MSLSSRRSTIRSSCPCSSRNSERWKPSGSGWRIVSAMTRGPAKPMSARGSARMTSPSMAKLAVTPPVVGSVRTERYGSPASASRCERGRGLGHLHQREDALLHAGAAGGRHDDHRHVLVDGQLDGARQLLADHRAHAAAEEAELEDAQHDGMAADARHAGDDRLLHRGLLLGGLARGRDTAWCP